MERLSATAATTMLVTCQDCQATCQARPAKAGGAKTPRSWKRVADGGGYRCPKCQAAQYMPRSIRLRILGPHESEPRDAKAMYQALYEASCQSNQFANWYLQRLLAADAALVDQIGGLPRTASGAPKLPPTPQVEWYADATRLFPHVAPSSLVQQARMVASYYARERFAALVAKTRNVRSYRWDGLPVVVNGQAWKLVRLEDERIVLRAQIGPGKSWTLSVAAQGQNLQRMRQLADGEATAGTAVFVRRAREPRPGETKRVRVWYLRISAQVPRPATARRAREGDRTLTLGHDADCLLYGVLDERDETFEYPAPTLRALIAAHKKLDRQRQIDASFRRQGWSRRKARRWAAGRSAACARNNKKIRAEIDLAAASLVRWCQAQRVGEVNYDTTPRGWIESFPYQRLRERIKTSLENAGIYLHVAGETGAAEPSELHETEQPASAGPKRETGDAA